METYDHVPVLLEPALKFWAAKPDGYYVDGTLGLGGHAQALLSAFPHCHVLGMDVDARALELARERLKKYGNRIVLFKENHMNLARAVDHTDFARPDGILLDLGVSSLELEDPGRGFSFNKPGPLDMRMDSSANGTALDLIR